MKGQGSHTVAFPMAFLLPAHCVAAVASLAALEDVSAPHCLKSVQKKLDLIEVPPKKSNANMLLFVSSSLT